MEKEKARPEWLALTLTPTFFESFLFFFLVISLFAVCFLLVVILVFSLGLSAHQQHQKFSRPGHHNLNI